MTSMGEDLQILKGKLNHISTNDFNLLGFVESLIEYRVKHFQEVEQKVKLLNQMKELKKEKD